MTNFRFRHKGVVNANRYEEGSTGYLPFTGKNVEREVWLPRACGEGWNARFLKHFGDWIGHQLNGGTHPYHVDDLLHRKLEKPLIGYRLV